MSRSTSCTCSSSIGAGDPQSAGHALPRWVPVGPAHVTIASPTTYRLTLTGSCGSGAPRNEKQNCILRPVSDNPQCHFTRARYASHVREGRATWIADFLLPPSPDTGREMYVSDRSE